MANVVHFEVYGPSGRYRCIALYKYYPYWIDKQARLKNDKFDKASGFILSLKTPSNRDFQAAVAHFGKVLTQAFGLLGNMGTADVIVVPSSKAGRVSDGLERVVKKACDADKRLRYRPGAIRRIKDIDKLANGGNRSVDVHYNSLEYKQTSKSSSVIILVDDVSTTGNSLIACAELVKANQPGVTDIIGFVLGKTHHD